MPINPISLTAPTDYSAEAQAIERRRRLAEALQQQSMEPIQTQTAGGYVVPISPTQGLAKMLQAYVGAQGERKATQDTKALATSRNQALVDALNGMPRTRTETQPIPYANDDQGNPMPPAQRTVQPTMADNVQWLGKLAQIGPEAVQMGTGVLSMQQRADENALTRQAQLEQKAMQLEAMAQNASLARQDREAARLQAEALRREMMQQQQAFAAQQAQANREFQASQARQAAADRVALAQVTQQNKPLTEVQGKSAMYGTRAAQSDKILQSLEDKINLPGLAAKQAIQNIPLVGGMLGAAGNVMLSPEQQRVEQAQRDFVNAVLRQESGAAISPTEFESAKRQYFPQPGDSKEVIAQKRMNRQLAIKGFERMAGPAGGDVRQIAEAPLVPSAAPQAAPSGFKVLGRE